MEKRPKIRKISREELRRMQLIQVQILGEVDRICMKYGISYAIEGGTLLGAVRHKGFIPWDDDIDIAMLRSEYIKFCKACETELDSKQYFLQNHSTDPEYRWGYAKVLKNGTSFVRYGQEHMKMKNGVNVEILPMDGIPANPAARILFNWIRVCCRKIMYSEAGKVNAKRAGVRLWYRLINKIPVERAFAALDYLAGKYDERKAEYVTCLSLRDYWVRGYHGYKREYYVNTKKVAFETKQVNAPQKDKELLRTLFGDNYMLPPPEEERESHIPVSSIDF